jgi:hypothetical protein
MLTANRLSGPGFGRDALFEVTASGAAIGTINDTRSTFQLGERSFRSRHSGFLGPTFQLQSGDTTIATARQKPFLNNYVVTCGGREWTFRATVLVATKFGLFENETQTGTISSGPVLHRTRDITADLPDDLPREVQMFLLLLFIRQLTTTAS